MFEPPDADTINEWNLFQAARWAGVPPWELAEQPLYWFDRILSYMKIDRSIQDNEMKRARGGK